MQGPGIIKIWGHTPVTTGLGYNGSLFVVVVRHLDCYNNYEYKLAFRDLREARKSVDSISVLWRSRSDHSGFLPL